MAKAVFDALARITKEQMTRAHFEAFEKETRGNSSHRGSAILLVTNVENALEFALFGILVQDRTDNLFGMERPLGSFRNKIWMAYAMNIFGDETLHNLECMRQIRNAFAHAKIPVNFETNEIAAVCSVMTIPILLPPHVMGAEKMDKSHLIGIDRFREVCKRIGHNLVIRASYPQVRINRGGIDALKLGISPAYTELLARAGPLP